MTDAPAADPTAELVALERAAWDALSTSGEAATAFYDEHLASEVLMLLPGGMVLDDRAAVVASLEGSPWSGYELHDERVLPLGDDAAVVAYRGVARRGGDDYEALFNSTWVRQGGAWRLALHQQTPAG